MYHCPIDKCNRVNLRKNVIQNHVKQEHRNYTPKENDFEPVVGN